MSTFENPLLEAKGITKYFLVIWKNQILDCVIMEYNITPTGVAKGSSKTGPDTSTYKKIN